MIVRATFDKIKEHINSMTSCQFIDFFISDFGYKMLFVHELMNVMVLITIYLVKNVQIAYLNSEVE